MKLLICLAVVLLIITSSVICFSIDGATLSEDPLSLTTTTLPSVQITETTTPEYYSHLNRHQHHQNDHPDHQYTKPSTESSESVENTQGNENEQHRNGNNNNSGNNNDNNKTENNVEENDSEEVTNGNENLDYENVVKEEESWPAKTNPPPIKTNSTGLQRDFEDFLQLIPFAEVKNVSVKYYRKDLEIRSIVNYMRGREFIQIRNNVFALQDVQDFANYLKDVGVNFVALVNFIKQLIGDFDGYDLTIPHYNHHHVQSEGGLDGYLEQLVNIIPQDQMYVLFFDKMESSIRFSEFVDKIGSSECELHLNNLKNSSDLQMEFYRLERHGISVKKLTEFFKTLIGWGNFNHKTE